MVAFAEQLALVELPPLEDAFDDFGPEIHVRSKSERKAERAIAALPKCQCARWAVHFREPYGGRPNRDRVRDRYAEPRCLKCGKHAW